MDEDETDRFFYLADASYKALKADPDVWALELEERAEWDATLMDGLEDEEPWPEDAFRPPQAGEA